MGVQRDANPVPTQLTGVIELKNKKRHQPLISLATKAIASINISSWV